MEAWFFHAYEYGWRRHFMHDENSPYDPERKWFDRRLVDQAQEFWAAGRRRRPTVEKWQWRVAAAYRWAMAIGQPMPPGIPENDPRVERLVHRFEEFTERESSAQERERAAAWAKIIGDGTNPDGSPSAESIAYVELCCRQIRANLDSFVARSRAAFTNPDGSRDPEEMSLEEAYVDRFRRLDELAETQRALGLSAKPQSETKERE